MNTDQRIIEIESKIAYQEDLAQALNDVVYRQQEKLTRLEAHIRKLVERIKALEDQRDGEQDDLPPPHY